jgi:hypothetical protein
MKSIFKKVDSHGQARGTKTYTLSANNKRIHPRLKAWSSAWLASFSGNPYASTASMKGRL